MMNNDGFFMNVNTKIETNASKQSKSKAKKLEKKNKYTEKRLLNKKRQRDTPLAANKQDINNNNNNKEKEAKIFVKKNFLDYNNQTFKNNSMRENQDVEKSQSSKYKDEKKINNSFKKNTLPRGETYNYKNKTNNNSNESNQVEKNQECQDSKNLNLKEDEKRENKEKETNKSVAVKTLSKEVIASSQNNLKDANNNEEYKDDLIDELNEFYYKKEESEKGKQKRLTTEERQKNKEKIKKMKSEIETEIHEMNTHAEEAKNNRIEKENNIDYSSSVFSLKDFQDLDISIYLKRVLQKENLSIMTKIQKKSIPILLKHRDVVVKSETGSGKTLAYVIPVYDFLINLNIKNKINRKDGVYVIIFAPTHELCLQIESTIDKLKSACINAVFGSLMGGQSIETEKARLRKGLNIIVSTPGRLLYHLKNTSTLSFTNLKLLVFDEADILLNMGFEKDIKECMRLIYNNYIGAPLINVENNNNNKSDKLNNKNITQINNNKIELENMENVSQNNINNEFNGVNISKGIEKSEHLNFEHFKKFKIFLISATIDNKIRKMADYLMKGFKTVGFEIKKDNNGKSNANNNELEKTKNDKEVIVQDEDDDENFNAPQNLVQEYSIVFDEFRLIHLICQIYNNINKKIIIFVSNCDAVNFLQIFLSEFEFNLSHIINEGEVGVGFNKYKNRNEKSNNNHNYSNNNKFKKGKENKFGKFNNSEENNGNDDAKNTDLSKLIKLVENPIYKLHGKMTHEERKKIFKEFNQDKPAILICTDVASRGLDFPNVDLIIHYDVNPDPKEYLNRMGRTARLDKSGNSLLFLMKHEEKILQNSIKKFTINNLKPGSILLNFVENLNRQLQDNGMKEKINTIPQAYKDEVDENEKYRKKYIFAIFPMQKSIKDYLFKNRENLINARKAFKSSIRSYVTFLRFQKDVFNVKALNLSRYARSFCLYKETSKIKVGNESVMIDYEAEKKNTKGNKKFNSKKFEKRLLISEFA